MAEKTVVFITGASRGIGQGLAATYLSRPNHIVVGSVRHAAAPSVQDLQSRQPAAGSRLILVTIEATSADSVKQAVRDVEAAGITHVDIAIANIGVATDLAAPAEVALDDITNAFQVNALGTVILYQAIWPLLKKAKSPKWVSVSSGAGSIGSIDAYGFSSIAAYGMSKVAMNYYTVSLHAAEKWLTAFAIHPGHVQTEMGNTGARAFGMEQAPDTIETSVTKTIATIDHATREHTSGKFIHVVEGFDIPW